MAVADWVLLAISEDRDQAREDAKRQIAFHATVRTYDRILDLHGFTEVAAQIRELWKSFDLAGHDGARDRRDARRDGGRRHSGRVPRRARASAPASADRLLLGAPVVATDPDRIRAYHDAIVETFAR